MSDESFEAILRQMQDGAEPLVVLGAQIVQFMKDKGVSAQEALKQLQIEIMTRKTLVEELCRLSAIENPDDDTRKRIEEISEAASDARWFKGIPAGEE